jgi:fatty-acyl-CoA synthase
MALMNLTLGQYLQRAATEWPRQPALIQSETGSALNWSELHQASDDYARGLWQLGLRRGDSILLWMGNRIEWCIAFFAAAKLGLIPSALCPQLESREIRYIAQHTNAKAIIFSDGHKGNAYLKLLECFWGETESDQEKAVPPLLIHVGSGSCALAIEFSSVLQAGLQVPGVPLLPEFIQPEDVAAIPFTSGTTCHPKGVMLTHLGLVNNSIGTARRFGLRRSDKLCIPVSLAHCFGMASGLLACVGVGATAVLVESYRVESVVRAVNQYGCTSLHGVPTMFQRVLEYQDQGGEPMNKLRTGIVAGAVCPETLMRRIVGELGMSELCVAYGQTEASPGCTQTNATDPLEVKLQTIGVPLPFVEMSVVNPSSGAHCGSAERGELCTRGYHVMKGYLGDPEKTAAAIDREGWLHTGDVGFVDEQGRFHYESRIKDLIIRGGENISPAEVEAALISHEMIRDAKVFGVPSAAYGEEIAACIQLLPGALLSAADVQQYLKGRIARFKIPSHIEFCGCLDTIASGKVNVRAMRERMIHKLAAWQIQPQQTSRSANS